MSKPTRHQSLSTTRHGPRFPTIDMYNFYTHPVRVIQSTGLTSSTHPGHIFLSDNHSYPLPTSPNTNTNFLATLRWYLQYKLVIPRNVYLFWPPEIKYSDFKGLNFGGSIHVSIPFLFEHLLKNKIFKSSPHEPKTLFRGGQIKYSELRSHGFWWATLSPTLSETLKALWAESWNNLTFSEKLWV